MKKIIAIFGTRPEAIKMCPLVRELQSRVDVQVSVCLSGQHRDMVNDVLSTFGVEYDHDLGVMREGQSLEDLSARIISKVGKVLRAERPDTVLVHGDTSTAMLSALAAFYQKIPVGHIEAGLRTYDIKSPFPEELDRRVISLIAAYHFAPTEAARDNLLRERVKSENIFVTGNTAIDALRFTHDKSYTHPVLSSACGKRPILLTMHRRENLGEQMLAAFRAVRRAADEFSDICILYPLHPNPEVRRCAESVLGGHDSIRLLPPLDVKDFHNIMARCYMVLTDSGGIQEEAPYFGKPVLVLRDTTERPEGVTAGTLRLAGVDESSIYREFVCLLTDQTAYTQMSRAKNPYGDGYASRRIADVLCR